MEAALQIIAVLLLAAFGFSVQFFRNEMRKKSRYRDFLDDALHAVEHNHAGNRSYVYSNTKGVAFSKDDSGNIRVDSQSKLCGTAIEY